MQGAVRGRVRQEEVAGRRGRATSAQIGQERLPHILRQREQAFGVRFTGAESILYDEKAQERPDGCRRAMRPKAFWII
jgi:hypothetical protein